VSAASLRRWFHNAVNPSAPSSGIRSVHDFGTVTPNPCTAVSTASFAITR
jgi:hypothetical protein